MAVGDRTNFGGTAYDRLRILTSYRNIAMVGLSSNAYQPSSFAGIYLRANGYHIIPVNPSQAGKHILERRDQIWLTRPRDICAHIESLPSGVVPGS